MLPTSVNGRRQRRYWDAKRPESVIIMPTSRSSRCACLEAIRTKDVSIVLQFEFRRGFCTLVSSSCVCVYPSVFSVPGLAASAFVYIRKQRYTRVSLRLFLDFDSWIFA